MRKAESSELYPKPSKEVQATLHGTQITNPLSHNHLHTHTSDLQFKIYQDAIEQSNAQIKPLTQCKHCISPPFAPQTRAEAEVSHLEK
jgi:hypothetical protein